MQHPCGIKHYNQYQKRRAERLRLTELKANKTPTAPMPVVCHLTGTGGSTSHSEVWAYWLAKQGIASIIVNSRGIRGRKNLKGMSAANYASDCKPALEFAKDETEVHVFYGELDGWGTYDGNRNACARMASREDNATFHLLKDAHHGFDGLWKGTWISEGQSFISAPNQAATQYAKDVVLKAVSKKWNLPTN
jgi:dienelactone hydrolase